MTKQEQIADPECPVDVWWDLAREYPIEAMQSVLYPLLILEEPDRWQALELANAEKWAKRHCDRLSAKEGRLFAADCAEHALFRFEEEYPSDDRPRHAIEIARSYAKKTATKSQLTAAHRACLRACAEIDDFTWGHTAATSAVWASSPKDSDKHVAFAVSNAFEAGQDREGMHEGVWQWHRFLGYLRGEHRE
jgi:hypothetical protein